MCIRDRCNICPNQDVFLFLITFSTFLFSPVLANTSSFLTLYVHFTLFILRCNHISKLTRYLSSFFFYSPYFIAIQKHSPNKTFSTTYLFLIPVGILVLTVHEEYRYKYSILSPYCHIKLQIEVKTIRISQLTTVRRRVRS